MKSIQSIHKQRIRRRVKRNDKGKKYEALAVSVKEEREKLIAKETSIYTESGRFICSVPLTDRGLELLDDEGWDKPNESWIDYRNRTKVERNAEKQKQIQFAAELVRGYNYINSLGNQ